MLISAIIMMISANEGCGGRGGPWILIWRPDQTRPHQTTPDHSSPVQARPGQAGREQIWWLPWPLTDQWPLTTVQPLVSCLSPSQGIAGWCWGTGDWTLVLYWLSPIYKYKQFGQRIVPSSQLWSPSYTCRAVLDHPDLSPISQYLTIRWGWREGAR